MSGMVSNVDVLPFATEVIETCPACNTAGKLVLRDCVDYVTGLPGRWNFSQCSRCCSLWLNPRPLADAAALLYPERYTFTRSGGSQFEFPTHGFTASLKNFILAHCYGYAALANAGDSRLGKMLARLGRFLPSIRHRAGYAVRFLSKTKARPRLLDVGCGDGHFLAFMRELGWEVEGVEMDPIAAQIAQRRNLKVRVGAIETSVLPRETYDAITLTHVTEHLFEPRKIFAVLAQSLKRGGYLVSISPNPQGILRRIFRNAWYELDPPRHSFIPSARACRVLLDPNAFAIDTWTSLRLFPWAFKESLSIARTGAVNALPDSAAWKIASSFISSLAAFFPGAGEELICYARKR